MEIQNQHEPQRNYFYPNCGCKNEADCVLCPHCGMCTVRIERCACKTPAVDLHESLRYDAHRDIMGG